jgi:hypothetical protein
MFTFKTAQLILKLIAFLSDKIDSLATYLELYVFDQDLANPVDPPESVNDAARGCGNDNVIQLHTHICAVDQITVPADQAGNFP